MTSRCNLSTRRLANGVALLFLHFLRFLRCAFRHHDVLTLDLVVRSKDEGVRSGVVATARTFPNLSHVVFGDGQHFPLTLESAKQCQKPEYLLKTKTGLPMAGQEAKKTVLPASSTSTTCQVITECFSTRPQDNKPDLESERKQICAGSRCICLFGFRTEQASCIKCQTHFAARPTSSNKVSLSNACLH